MGAEEKYHGAEMFTEDILIWFSSFHVAAMQYSSSRWALFLCGNAKETIEGPTKDSE